MTFDRLFTSWSFSCLITQIPVWGDICAVHCAGIGRQYIALPFFRLFRDSNPVSGSCAGTLPIELYNQIYCLWTVICTQFCASYISEAPKPTRVVPVCTVVCRLPPTGVVFLAGTAEFPVYTGIHRPSILAGTAGFEPARNRVKVCCLTA